MAHKVTGTVGSNEASSCLLVGGGLVLLGGIGVADDSGFACRQSGYKKLHGRTIVTCEVPVSGTQTFEIRYRWKVGSGWSSHQSHYLRGSSTWRLTLRSAAPDSGSFQFAWQPFSTGAALSNWIPVIITESPPRPTPTPSATPAVPSDASAELGADNRSIDVSWSVPSGAHGVDLSIVSRSDQKEVFRQEFSSTHKGGSDGVMYRFLRVASSEAYDVRLRSYAVGKSGAKVYSEWAASITVVVPPELTLCFLVSGSQPDTDDLRCFWENAASVDEYEFEVRAKPDGDQVISGDRFLKGIVFPVLQRPQRKLQRSAHHDVPTVVSGTELEIRVRVKGPLASEWSGWTGITATKLAELPPRCVQAIGQPDALGRHPVKCWLPYHRQSTLKIYYGGQKQEQIQVNGGVAEAVMLASKAGHYTAKWFTGSNSESNGYNFEVNSYDNEKCPPHPVLRSPLSATSDISSGYYFRPHPKEHVVKIHTGIDLGGYYGEVIYAAHSGELIGFDYSISTLEGGDGYGNYIAIRYQNSTDQKDTCWHSFYAHVLSPHHPNCRAPKTLTQVGVSVTRGEIIGCVGSTGISTDPHLHFEMRHGAANAYTRVANYSRNLLDPELFQKYDVLGLLAVAADLTADTFSFPPQIRNFIGCPSVVENPNSCNQNEKYRVAGIPAVRCFAGASSVKWYWSVPEGTAEFRWSNDSARAHANWSTSSDASTTSLAVSGSPGKRLSLYVQARGSGDPYWSWSGSASCVVKPREVSVSCSSTSSSVAWSWLRPAGAVAQEISFDGTTWKAHATGRANKRDLSPGDGATLFVRARGSGDTHWSWEGAKGCGAVPVAPSVSCVAGSSSITWTWGRPGITKAYQSRYYLGSTLGYSMWMEETGNSNSRRKSGLSLGDEVTLEVQEGNEWGWSVSGSAKCETTDAAAPEAPQVLCSGATSDTATWTWNTPTGAEKFQTRYSVNIFHGYSKWTPQGGNSQTISGLAPTVVITLYVQAGNSAGWSSDGSASCTNPYEVPSSPNVTCTPTTNSISWKWPQVKWATRYRVSYDGSNWIKPTSRKWTREDLSSGTKLRLYVQAGNPAGWSPADWAECTVKSSTGK